MKKLLFLFFFIVSALPIFANAETTNESDKCHVYIVDVKKAEYFDEKIYTNKFQELSEQEQEKLINEKSGVTMFDEFETEVCEECLTTKTYKFPNSNLKITASVYYTDEMMASVTAWDSMLVGIAVDNKFYKQAFQAPNNAGTEITYNEHTDTIRVKKNIKVKGRDFIVGVECHCIEKKDKEEK